MKQLVMGVTPCLLIFCFGCSSLKKSFDGEKVAVSGEFTIDQPASRVFKLYGPEEEKWAPGWEPEWVFPDAKTARTSKPQKNWIFKIKGKQGESSTWTIKEYDLEKMYTESYVVTPGVMEFTIQVQVESVSSNQSETKVTYTYTGLSEKGNKIVSKKNQETHDKELAFWKKMIEYYLKNGKAHPK